MPRFPRWWVRAAFLVPAVITAAGLVVCTGGIERSVEAEAHRAAPAAHLAVDGRDVTVKGVPAEQIAGVKKDVAAARGVRDVSVEEPRMPPMRLAFGAGRITVSGSTEQQAWRERFVQALSARTHGHPLVDETKTVVGTDFPMTTPAAEAVVNLLAQLRDDLAVDVTPGTVTVTGTLQDGARRTAVIGLFKRLFGEAVADKTTTKE